MGFVLKNWSICEHSHIMCNGIPYDILHHLQSVRLWDKLPSSTGWNKKMFPCHDTGCFTSILEFSWIPRLFPRHFPKSQVSITWPWVASTLTNQLKKAICFTFSQEWWICVWGVERNKKDGTSTKQKRDSLKWKELTSLIFQRTVLFVFRTFFRLDPFNSS